jgi:nitrite reductase/ring-hydroxylating ferredoxin subunit
MSADDDVPTGDLTWHKVAEPGELEEESVKMAVAAGKLVAISLCQGRYGALDNVCPHMGGPLGQGRIEDGKLVCPWHGREFDPGSGRCEGYEEAVPSYPVEERDDGVYIGLSSG